MRTLIIADVHANLSALTALPRADLIICAGDVVTFGPDPSNCIEWLTARRALCVRGDEDDAIGNDTEHQLPQRLSQAGLAARAWTAAALTRDERGWLSGLPPEIETVVDRVRVGVVHAYPGDYNRYLCPNDEELHRLTRAFPHADVIVIGHTHRPGLWRYRGKIILNPGSVGQPLIPGKACYALLQSGKIKLGSVAYDHTHVIQQLNNCGLEAAAVSCCAEELRRGSARPTSRLDPVQHLVSA